jgi:hypothetical protein
METGIIETDETSIQIPRWIAQSIIIAEGRDPLGFQTTTQDRLMPLLLPGILELTRRARYFSFHVFILDEYQKRRLPPNGKSLSIFIKRCEWDLGLAVQRCRKGCNSSPVGARYLGNLAAGIGPFPRRQSVESALGGYGLYYRSPLESFGIVAKSGTLLGGQPTPIDLLYNNERAHRLADSFRKSVKNTEYYRKWMWTNDEIPAQVVDEYSAAACLCGLDEHPNEQKAIRDAIFTSDIPQNVSEPLEAFESIDSLSPEVSLRWETVQRRRSVAHYLSLLNTYPNLVSSESAFRKAMWAPPKAINCDQEVVAGQWAGLIAKDIWQEAVCSVWSELCRTGMQWSHELGRGLTWLETKNMVSSMVSGLPTFNAENKTSEVIKLLNDGLKLSVPNGSVYDVTACSLDELGALTARLDTAASGLVCMLEMFRRLADRADHGWMNASKVRSRWQPSLIDVFSMLRSHLEESPSIGESLWWMVYKFILGIHERVSYSKLPENTFRFRWEDGLLVFFNNGIGRFPLAGIRADSLASLTRDLGLWQVTSEGNYTILTEVGKSFITEVFNG